MDLDGGNTVFCILSINGDEKNDVNENELFDFDMFASVTDADGGVGKTESDG